MSELAAAKAAFVPGPPSLPLPSCADGDEAAAAGGADGAAGGGGDAATAQRIKTLEDALAACQEQLAITKSELLNLRVAQEDAADSFAAPGSADPGSKKKQGWGDRVAAMKEKAAAAKNAMAHHGKKPARPDSDTGE